MLLILNLYNTVRESKFEAVKFGPWVLFFQILQYGLKMREGTHDAHSPELKSPKATWNYVMARNNPFDQRNKSK